VAAVTEPEGMDELRRRLSRAEDDAAAARTLAGGADRDTAEIRTELREFRTEMRSFRDQNNRVLNAMRQDLVDLRGYVDRGFAGIQEQFAQVDRNFLTVTSKIDGVAAGVQALTDLLTRRERDDRPEG
jgi:hypothetical protein